MSPPDDTRQLQPIKVGGTVPDLAIYITRPEDEEVHDLLAAGTYCNILTSRQMGKSSLVHRVMQRLQAAGIRVVSVDLSALGGNQLKDGTAWYRALLLKMALSMGASRPFKAWWSERPAEEAMGARFQAFVEAFFLADPTSIVVVFDEVDVTQGLGFTDDLFLTIRSLHNERASRPELDRLTFCLVGVLTADELIKRSTSTPYNVGSTIRLTDFSRERCDLTPLDAYLAGHELPGAAVVDEILAWTSGQPFLTIALCEKAARARSADVEAFALAEINDPTTFKVHFNRIEQIVRERIAGSSHARSRYLTMLKRKSVPGVPERDEEALLLAGLVHRNADGSLRLRNRIYGLRFDERWVREILPAPPVPRWVWGLLAAIVVAGAGTGGVMWMLNRERTAREAIERQDKARRGAEEIQKATDDDKASAIWSSLQADGLAGDGSPAREAARAYWDRRGRELDKLAEQLGAAACSEEAGVVRAFAAARRGEEILAPSVPDVAATLWLPAQLNEGTEEERCKERRAEACDRLELSDGMLTASCSGKLVVFRPDRAPLSITGSGTGRARLRPDGSWSIGAVDDALLINRGEGAVTNRGEGAVTNRGEGAVTLPVCPAKGARDARRSTHVISLEIKPSGDGAMIAYVCSDGTYGRQSIARLDAWFEGLTKGNKSPPAEGGYGARAAAWLGDELLIATAGREGRVKVNGGPGLRLPFVHALASFAGNPRLVAFGTGSFVERETVTVPILGVLARSADHLAIQQQWPLTLCNAPSCFVRAVAGVDEDHVAGLLVDAVGGPSPSRTWLVLVREGQPDVTLLDESPVDVAVGAWQTQVVAAVPLVGRMRLHAWERSTDRSWEAAQRRIGLTIRYGESARIERFDEVGPQRVRRFEDLFPGP
ncbi:WD-repeat protein [Sorangium cellulosum So ce56]|uniref:WD-repeat protein n=1 Tax=Sorangium cellulosum (strain So ce56) TaxID=448385 RepID=A9GM92_SORC5|nr:AAA-like domain-containing protein [Sorangium cellulosum]CAN90387.1 WD-repeat protein [Sorangium cellulosum So ce56]